jgi:AcrR family transcriptional regulator
MGAREQSIDTATRLLDAGEKLFGKHGYDAVGMRALAQAAGVNLAAATYHFGSKQKLYLETLLRRFRALGAEQMQLLRAANDAAEAVGRSLAVKDIVECLMRPPFQMGRAHPGFSQLLVRTLAVPPAFMEKLAPTETRPVRALFVAELHRVLPGVSRAVIERRIGLSMGLLLMLILHRAKASESGHSVKVDEMMLEEVIGLVSAWLASTTAFEVADTIESPAPCGPARPSGPPVPPVPAAARQDSARSRRAVGARARRKRPRGAA